MDSEPFLPLRSSPTNLGISFEFILYVAIDTSVEFEKPLTLKIHDQLLFDLR